MLLLDCSVGSEPVKSSARVYRNKTYHGMRQPVNYTVDISCELAIDGIPSFFVIVECKNWQTLVGIGDVLSVIHIRDAVAA